MKLKRTFALLLALVLILGLFTGCGKDKNPEEQNDDKVNPPSSSGETVIPQAKYAWKADYLDITAPEGKDISHISGFCMGPEKAYLAAHCVLGMETMMDPATGEPMMDENGQPIEYEKYGQCILSMDPATGETVVLEGYQPRELPEGMEGDTSINNMLAGPDGTLWLLTQTYTYYYDLPENFDASSDEMWNYYVDGGRYVDLCQYSPDGTLLQTVSLDLDPEVYINEIQMDSKGNIYATDYETIYLIAADGTITGTLTNENGSELRKMGDDLVGVLTQNYETDNSVVFKAIDFETKAYGEEIKLAAYPQYLYPGFGEYAYLYGDNDSIYGVKEGAEEGEKLLSWLDCDVDSTYLEHVTFLEDGRIVAMESDYSAAENRYSLVSLQQVDASTIPEKKLLTLACFGLSWELRPKIVDFNRSHSDVRIVVQDYSEFSTEEDHMAGLTKLNTEIISGNIPDILDTASLPMEQYAAKGILQDLWPLIDSDPELSREDLMTHLFEAMSIDGKLYHITDTFSIQTAGVNSAIAAGRTSWTLDEVLEAMKGLQPDASIFSETDTKSGMLHKTMGFNLDSFIDWTNKTCSFDGEEFISLLEFCNTFPAEVDPNFDWATAESEYSRLMNGKQLMSTVHISSFEDIQVQAAYHGGDVTFIGFPTESGQGSCFNLGSTMAISTACKDTDAAWSFVRQLLLEENQTEDHMWNFPTNAHAFETYKKQAMTPIYETDPETGEQVEVSNSGYGIGDDFMLDVYSMKQHEFDAFWQLYENCNNVYSYDEDVMEIILEECEPFFAGQKTAADTANIIQNRLGLYLAEQG